MSQTLPYRWTGMIALVRGVTSFSADVDADAVVVEVHVGEAGNRPGLDHGEAGGDERVAGHDHLVARPDAQGRQADVQGGGAGGHADGVLAPLPLGELLLELHALRAGPVVHFARSGAPASTARMAFSSKCGQPTSVLVTALGPPSMASFSDSRAVLCMVFSLIFTLP